MRRILLALPIIIAAACSSPNTPLIGITCSRSDTGATLLATTYTEAVGKAGGVPVVIPTVSSPAEAEALLAKVDGIIFSGGEDDTPRHGTRTPIKYRFDKENYERLKAKGFQLEF